MSAYDILAARGVNRLCHFTKFQSLTHIIPSEAGVLASSSIRQDTKNVTDKERYDNELDYVCCSVQYPNSWFLKRAMQNNTDKIFKDWVVLYVDLSIAIAEVTIWALSEVIAPRVKAWWQEKAAPSLKRTWQGLSDKKTPQKGKVKPQLRANQILEAKMAVPNLFKQELDDAYEKYSSDMTSEEAQKELLDIFMLSAIVAAKMRKLSNAHIKDIGDVSGSYIEGKAVVERLCTPQFVNSINSILERNPRLLEESAVPLAGIIGRSLIVNGAFVPIERDAFRESLTLR